MQEKSREIQGFERDSQAIPAEKPREQRTKPTLAAEMLLEGELQGICRSLIEQAREGNIQAIKLILDRVLPPKRNPTVTIELPKLKSSSDALKAITAITQAVGNGEISPAEG